MIYIIIIIVITVIVIVIITITGMRLYYVSVLRNNVLVLRLCDWGLYCM